MRPLVEEATDLALKILHTIDGQRGPVAACALAQVLITLIESSAVEGRPDELEVAKVALDNMLVKLVAMAETAQRRKVLSN